MRDLRPLLGTALLITLAASGCRGWTSDQPPVHLNPNMDTQEKHKAYRGSDFFDDGRSMRTPPEGTVARTVAGDSVRDDDFLRLDEAYYFGTASGKTLAGLPDRLRVSSELLARGQERYNIYCAPCHAQHGSGEGTVASRLTIKPPDFHTDTLRGLSVSHFYRIITHGKPLPEDGADRLNMPSYAAQVPVEDRWAIALYVRALQQSQYAGGVIPMDGLGSSAPSEAPVDGAPSNPSEGAAPAATPDSAAKEAADGSTP